MTDICCPITLSLILIAAAGWDAAWGQENGEEITHQYKFTIAIPAAPIPDCTGWGPLCF